MKCPNCGSNKIFTCTNKMERPFKKYFECIDCFYQSKKVAFSEFSPADRKPSWEIELEKIKKEWE